MLTIDGTKISLTRGDSALLIFGAVDSSGQEYVLKPGDTITFTVKESSADTAAKIKKISSTWQIQLEPEDTKPLEFKKYFYDVQLTTTYNDHQWIETIIEKAIFKVGEEIG